MHGVYDILKSLKLGDHKWDVNNYDYVDIVNNLTDNDLEIVRLIDSIGDGELSAIGITIQHQDLVRKLPKELGCDFYESNLYGFCTITYEEMRHGFILKELASLVKNGKSFIENATGNHLYELMYETNTLYKNAYESLLSYLLGEITNIELYSSIESHIESNNFRKIIINIKKDEIKHKAAWIKIISRMVKSKDVHRKNFTDAVISSHFIHQAEVSNYFVQGANDVSRFFTTSTYKKVLEDKYETLIQIFGELPISKRDLFYEFSEYYNKKIKKVN
ncbi:MAG: hypothetical protein LBG21_07435 [Campylobacteraceae bacterium]|nr:hypothetical protein [Campylobacteraceae bacterium]